MKVTMATEMMEIPTDMETTEEAQSVDTEFTVDLDVEGDLEILQVLAKEDNIANLLTEDQVRRLGGLVIEDLNGDMVDRKDRERRMESAMKLAMQVSDPKNTPWPGAANVKYPLLIKAAVDFAARAYPSIVQDGRIAKGVVIGSDEGIAKIDLDTGEIVTEQDAEGQPVLDENDEPKPVMVGEGRKREKADRVSGYINYQLMEEMDCWEEDTDRLLNAVAVCGSMFRKEFYNPLKGYVDSYIIYPKNFVLPYYAKSIESSPRTSELMELQPHIVKERERAGLFTEIDYAVSNETLEDATGSVDDQESPSSNDKQTPHIFVEQHRLIDMDGDGYAEPYIVTVHKETEQVVRILARYDEFTTGDPVNEQIVLKPGEVLVTNEGVIARIEPECYYTKYGFIPSPDGSIYDLGFGDLLMPLNESINTIINQLLDAGTLANMSTGFIGKGLRMKGGAVKITPGKWPRVESTGGSIKDNIVPIQHTPPSMALFELLGVLIEAGKELGTIKDVLTGEAAVNQAATTTMAMIEQGLKAFQSIYKRIHRSIKKELKRVYYLNGKYLPQESYYTVLGQSNAVAKDDFSTDVVDIVPVSDPDVSTDMQKMAQANFLSAYLNDPNIDRIKVFKLMFKAMRIPDADDLIVEQPPQPSPQLIKQLTDQIRKEVTDKTEQDRIKLEDDRKRKEIDAKKDIEGEKIISDEKINVAKIAADLIKNATNNLVAEDDAVGVAEQNRLLALAIDELSGNSSAFTDALKEFSRPRKRTTTLLTDEEGNPTGSETLEE
jgi:chaperonin GroES